MYMLSIQSYSVNLLSTCQNHAAINAIAPPEEPHPTAQPPQKRCAIALFEPVFWVVAPSGRILTP
jgi:hypothetical protein